MTRRELEVTDPVVIRQILDQSKVLHLGLVDDGMPYIVPMNYGYVMEGETPCQEQHSIQECNDMVYTLHSLNAAFN